MKHNLACASGKEGTCEVLLRRGKLIRSVVAGREADIEVLFKRVGKRWHRVSEMRRHLKFSLGSETEFQWLPTLNICMSITFILIWVFQFVNSVNNVNVNVRSPPQSGNKMSGEPRDQWLQCKFTSSLPLDKPFDLALSLKLFQSQLVTLQWVMIRIQSSVPNARLNDVWKCTRKNVLKHIQSRSRYHVKKTQKRSLFPPKCQ